MKSLYLDTSEGLKLGLLNEELNWIDFLDLETRRTSDVVHSQIVNILEKYNLSISDIDSVFLMAGPGSYTGMRVAEGIAQVLEMEGKQIFSFHSFRIPQFLGLENYRWVYPAFKGEIHIRSSNGTTELLLKEDFQRLVAENDQFTYITHGANEVSEYCQIDTTKNLSDTPEIILKSVRDQDLRDRPFYFRPADVEFKKSSK